MSTPSPRPAKRAQRLEQLIRQGRHSDLTLEETAKARPGMSTTLFLVFRNPGPSWVPGLPSRRQPLWDEHAVFMDRLFEQGRIILGGPYADNSRALLIVQADGTEEASELFRDDPWALRGILVESEVIEWSVFLDSRRIPDESK